MTRFTPLYLQSGSYAASVDRRLLGALWPGPASSGCAVAVGAGMQLNVAAGSVAVPSQNNTGTTLCVSDAQEAVVLPAAPASGLNRIDLVIVRPRGADLDGGPNNDFIFDSVQGVEAATAVVPATPAGTVALARVLLPGGSAAITGPNITDVRPWGLAVASGLALPPPLGAGAPIASITDQSGEVWVAKGGVNGGAWRKARDVLAANVYRTAALSFPGPYTTVPFDTVQFDAYGLWIPATSRFRAPVAGVWAFALTLHASCYANGYLQAAIQSPTTAILYPTTSANGGTAQTIGAHTSALYRLNANDEVQAFSGASGALAMQVPGLGAIPNRFTATYVGTG